MFIAKGTLIILVDGENSGEVMVVPLNGYMGSTFRILHFNNDVINQDYLSFFILYNKQNLKDNKTGSTIPHLNKKIFNSLSLILPDINKQKSIVHKISLIFDILDKLINSQKSYYENKLTLGDVLYYEQPWKYSVESTNYDNSYNTPVLTPGKTFILGYTNETTGIYDVGKSKVIIFDDFTTASRLVDFNFKVKSSAMKILSSANLDKFNIEYIFYLLQTINVISNTHKRYWISEYMQICVNIHTINEQKKIVNKINTMFTILNSMSNSI